MKAFAPALLALALSACAVGPDYRAPMTEPARFKAEGGQSMPRAQMPAKTTEVKVRKPSSHSNH